MQTKLVGCLAFGGRTLYGSDWSDDSRAPRDQSACHAEALCGSRNKALRLWLALHLLDLIDIPFMDNRSYHVKSGEANMKESGQYGKGV